MPGERTDSAPVTIDATAERGAGWDRRYEPTVTPVLRLLAVAYG